MPRYYEFPAPTAATRSYHREPQSPAVRDAKLAAAQAKRDRKNARRLARQGGAA